MVWAHSLLLMLSSSDYPDFIPLTGIPERWWFASAARRRLARPVSCVRICDHLKLYR